MNETLTPIQCPMCKGEGDIKPTSIGGILRIKRAERSFTLKDVQCVTGVSYSTLSRIENNLTHPSLQDGLKIAKWCGLSGDDLMALMEVPNE